MKKKNHFCSKYWRKIDVVSKVEELNWCHKGESISAEAFDLVLI